MPFEDLINTKPFGLCASDKEKALTRRLTELTSLHRKNCSEYSKILNALNFNESAVNSYYDLPFLPVRLFKKFDLKSCANEDIVKTMTSSGTMGQQVSKIYLDRATSANQQKAMVKIVSDFTGSSRMPMIIIDTPTVLKDRQQFSARGAGILGFSVFGTRKIYALNDDMSLNVDGLLEFLNSHKGATILLFGFTFMVWQHFLLELERLQPQGISVDLTNGVLIHGGGWKKLQAESVNDTEFKRRLNAICGLTRVHDYYGMVEQTGCIYMQCERGALHASIFSDVIVRKATDFSICKIGEEGVIQVVSTIPESYPGHSLLTEDLGIILGEDDCSCGRQGKFFKINGRLKNAEIRGCSDTYAAGHNGA